MTRPLGSFSFCYNVHMTRLPNLGDMPPIGGIVRWLNTDTPITKDDLLGHVVLLEFMTSSCINCIRTFPTLTRWHETYNEKGLRVIGIHTPEFPFEHEESVVEKALKKYHLSFPVGMDNDYVSWRNFQNRYWPTTYLFDADGQLRYTHIGEGNFQNTEAAIRSLLKETGVDFKKGRLAKDDEIDLTSTIEAYLGHAKPGNLASPERIRRGDIQTYSVPDKLEIGVPALEGRWRIEGDHAVTEEDKALTIIRFFSKEARAVLAPPKGTSATCRVRLDGKMIGKRYRGEDVIERDGQTYLIIDNPRSFQLLSGKTTEGVLEIICLNSGTSIYNMTF